MSLPEGAFSVSVPRHHGRDVLIIRPSAGRMHLGLGELWEHRELLYFLVWRDLKVRYKQTVLGVAWAILQPLLTMVVFSVFFGRLAGVPSDGLPYPVFAYAALLPWQLFASSLASASASVVGSQSLITKVYFPRLLVPLASVLSGFVDFALAFVVLIALMVHYQIRPGLAFLTLPLFVALALTTALAVGLWLSVLNVKYRDIRYTVPFLTQLWLFTTPVAYPASVVPESWRMLYGLNPMVGVVEGFRWAVLGRSGGVDGSVLVSGVAVALLLVGGLAYFQRTQATFADVV